MHFHDRSELSEGDLYDRLKQKGSHQENRDDCVILSLKKPSRENIPTWENISLVFSKASQTFYRIKMEVAVW